MTSDNPRGDGDWQAPDHPERGAGIGAEALARAHAAVQRLSETYIAEVAPANLAELEMLVEAARQSPADRRAHATAIYRIAHDMKGQGGAFGLPLLSEIGGRLCSMTAQNVAVGTQAIAALDACLKAARITIAERIHDLDGPDAKRVLSILPTLG